MEGPEHILTVYSTESITDYVGCDADAGSLALLGQSSDTSDTVIPRA